MNKQVKLKRSSPDWDEAMGNCDAQIASIDDQKTHHDEIVGINLLPSEGDLIAAEIAVDTGSGDELDLSLFQTYVALIAACVLRGHNHVGDIVARLAPIVGADNAVHLIWLIEILSGPAADVHLWEWNKPEPGMFLHGPALHLKPELEVMPTL